MKFLLIGGINNESKKEGFWSEQLLKVLMTDNVKILA